MVEAEREKRGARPDEPLNIMFSIYRARSAGRVLGDGLAKRQNGLLLFIFLLYAARLLIIFVLHCASSRWRRMDVPTRFSLAQCKIFLTFVRAAYYLMSSLIDINSLVSIFINVLLVFRLTFKACDVAHAHKSESEYSRIRGRAQCG